MSRRCHRRGRDGRDALFAWNHEGDIEPGEVRDNPLMRHCPRCGSPAFEWCSRIARGRGRVRLVGRYHDERTTPIAHNRPETPPSAPIGARTAPCA